MGHTPLGYKIKNGKAFIDSDNSIKIQNLYNYYLEGLSLAKAAEKAKLNLSHSSTGRILKNPIYLGNDFYPQLIDKVIFNAVQKERDKRVHQLGRIFPKKEKPFINYPKVFELCDIKKSFHDPFEQAEYVYSLVHAKE